MSIGSPVKQERIERHLMRQRGAGVRTVSANFGFSFTSSAPPSSDATPTTEEPSAKRRKTALHHVINAIGLDNDLERPDKASSAPSQSRARKPRRRLALEDDDNGHVSRPRERDDSFVAGLEAKTKTRKRRTKVTESTDPEVSACEAVPEPAVKGRLRTRAVAPAAVKVTEAVVEAAISLEQEKHTATHEDQRLSRTKRNKRQTANNATTSLIKDSTLPKDVVTQQAQVRTNRGGTRSTRAAITANNDHDLPPSPADVVTEYEAAIQTPPLDPEKSTLQKRKRTAAALDRRADHGTGVSRGENKTAPLMEISRPQFGTAASARKVRKNNKKQPMLTDALHLCAPSDLQRQPLTAINSNSPIRPTSPGKPATDSEAALAPRKQLQETSMQSHDKTSAHRKKRVRDDPVRLQATAEEPVVPETTHASDRAPTAVASTKNASRKKINPAVQYLKISNEVSAKDEDVDWLFEPQKAVSRLKLAPKYTTPINRAVKSRPTMPDIDLDDLLSNIALFANPGIGSGAPLERDTTKATRRPRKAR